MEQFDEHAHEAHVAARYEKLARIAAFDRLVDMALDGSITMDEAIGQYKTDLEASQQPQT
jgi:hypothetical protein